MSDSIPFSVSSCPHCRGETRVPETLYGQPVKCPHCGQFFRVTDPNSPAEKITPESGRPGSPTLLVGLVLLLVGLTGLLCDGALVVLSVTMEDRLVDEVIRQAKNPDPLLKRWLDLPEDFNPEASRGQIAERLEIARKVHFAFAGVSLVIAVGGVGVLRRKWYRLAILSCFLSMLNLGFCCCLMGLPAGVFGLVRLLDPDVKARFG
jgi:hypothetical protein